eukprot:CAMPEP_0195049936 /NCGR_PEP_ID=MMETSP0347-20130606/61991_1 /TAXON_ID=2932 /ORGANISM="Alexandrium fundyense, Strain CCMP1719" /LENGTH=53 /DNA_ID=CAMNT_0040078771 /DNA_START=12 /DNA_END=171 /DNA_ORIENTATION=-
MAALATAPAVEDQNFAPETADEPLMPQTLGSGRNSASGSADIVAYVTAAAIAS